MQQAAITEKSGRTVSDRLAFSFATGLGAGFAPIAPGTFGSAEAVGIFLLIIAAPLSPVGRLAWGLVLIGLTFAFGVWASTRTCEMSGLKDPGQVVIDEVCGQLIALTPLTFAPSIMGVAAAFFLFRFFDIFKPYPIYKLERLPGGWGVMADDVLAGIYTAVLVWLGHRLQMV